MTIFTTHRVFSRGFTLLLALTIMAGLFLGFASKSFARHVDGTATSACPSGNNPANLAVVTVTVRNTENIRATISIGGHVLELAPFATGSFTTKVAAGSTYTRTGTALFTPAPSWQAKHPRTFEVSTPTKSTCYTPPSFHKTRWHLRVIDRCKCKHDTVQVIGKHLDKVKIRKDKNHWTITVKAKRGYKVPIKPGYNTWVRKTVFHYNTTSKPCHCKATHSCHGPKQNCRPTINGRGRNGC